MKSLLLIFIFLVLSCQRNPLLNLNTVPKNHSDSIIGGTVISKEDPVSQFTVGLFDRKNKFLCTGSLIGPNKVLTAAHCIQDQGLNLVVIFDTSFSALDDKNNLLLRSVTAAWPHPDFKKNKNQDLDWADLAVLIFAGEAPQGFKPIEILSQDSLFNRGSKVFMAGFGASQVDYEEVLKRDKKFRQGVSRGEILCWDDEEQDCIRLSYSGFETLRKTSATVQGFTEKEIRLNENEGRGTCAGDSGGPLFIEHENSHYLVGVTSRGTPLCNGAAVYTNIYEFRNWLESIH